MLRSPQGPDPERVRLFFVEGFSPYSWALSPAGASPRGLFGRDTKQASAYRRLSGGQPSLVTTPNTDGLVPVRRVPSGHSRGVPGTVPWEGRQTCDGCDDSIQGRTFDVPRTGAPCVGVRAFDRQCVAHRLSVHRWRQFGSVLEGEREPFGAHRDRTMFAAAGVCGREESFEAIASTLAELSDDRQASTVDAERRDVHAQHLVGFDAGPGLDGEEVAAGGEQFLDDRGREAPLGEIAVFVADAGHRSRSYVRNRQRSWRPPSLISLCVERHSGRLRGSEQARIDHGSRPGERPRRAAGGTCRPPPTSRSSPAHRHGPGFDRTCICRTPRYCWAGVGRSGASRR